MSWIRSLCSLFSIHQQKTTILTLFISYTKSINGKKEKINRNALGAILCVCVQFWVVIDTFFSPDSFSLCTRSSIFVSILTFYCKATIKKTLELYVIEYIPTKHTTVYTSQIAQKTLSQHVDFQSADSMLNK